VTDACEDLEMKKFKPRMTLMYGIWSCCSPKAWGAGWTAEDAYENWKKALTKNIWDTPKPKPEVIVRQRFG